MIYIIGGLPRSGKSLVGKLLTTQYGINGIDTDVLRTVLNVDKGNKANFDSNSSLSEFINALWPYITKLLDSQIDSQFDYYITGEALDPDLIAEYKHLNKLRVVFMGFREIETKFHKIRTHSQSDDWTRKFNDTELLEILQKYQKRSLELEEKCKKYSFGYFDTSHDYPGTELDYEKTIKEVIKYLLPNTQLHPLKINKQIHDYTN